MGAVFTSTNYGRGPGQYEKEGRPSESETLEGDVLNRLRNHKEWSHVLKDPELERHLWAKHNLVQELWYHLQSERNRETRLMEGIANYLWARKAWELPLYTPTERKIFLYRLARRKPRSGWSDS